MSGNIAGGKRAAVTNKARFGEDFYRRIGAKGGQVGGGKGGFKSDPERARWAGKKGGKARRVG